MFASVDRYVLWEDEGDAGWHEAVECAVRGDGTSPAREWLDEMRAGTRTDDPRYQPPEDPEQIYDYHRMVAKIEHVGMYGCPHVRADVGHLREGIWEFRHGTRRLSYWDTPGDGTYTPKGEIADRRSLPEARQESDTWWYPDMDAVLRLGCAWDKTGQLAPPEKITEACDIRMEDLRHDAP